MQDALPIGYFDTALIVCEVDPRPEDEIPFCRVRARIAGWFLSKPVIIHGFVAGRGRREVGVQFPGNPSPLER